MSSSHSSASDSQPSQIPRHLGFILDGNRRWAVAQGLPTLEGHRKGYENLQDIAQLCFDRGIQYVSAFVFSTENWNRSKEEVGYLMDLAVKVAQKDTNKLVKNNIKVVMLGSEQGVPAKVLKAFRDVEERSKNNTGGTLALCFNYGGFQEITEAVKAVVEEGVPAEDITSDVIAQYLYHPEIPSVDLMVRTSGEQRLSNFMLWRVAYSELLFIKKHWPDFSEDDLSEVLREYAGRNRRFGA